MPIRLIVFDCDGVLFASERANVAFYNEVLRLAGEPSLTDGAVAACHALSSVQLFERYYADRPQQLSRLRRLAQELDYAPFYELMQPHEDLHAVLRLLRRSYRTAMATNRGKTTRGVLEHFGIAELFDLAVGVLDVERPKPHPDMLLKCIEHFSVSAAEAVYVGDQPTDAEAARAAGLRFIAMGGDVAASDLRIERLSDIPSVLAQI